ncbi:MAG: CBS domain-containing protein [Armatimonadetes bacterium]|nr:CBS domain-containing protein [Armatimonadota bacterium]
MAFVWFSNGIFEPYRIVPPTATPKATMHTGHKPEDQFTRVQRVYEEAAPRAQQRQQAILVRQIMSSPVSTLPPDATIERAHALLNEHGFRHVPIVAGPALVGIVSDRDLLRAASPAVPGNPRANLVGDVMSRRLLTVLPTTDIREAAKVMVDEGIHSLPVLDAQQKLVGIVTTSDILRCIVNRSPLDLWV